jgi:hypothetical protein
MAAAVGGLRRAGAQAAEAAQRIAAPPATGAMPRAEPAGDPGLAVVDLLVARRAYQANAMVVRTADAMAEALLRGTATPPAGGGRAGGR